MQLLFGEPFGAMSVVFEGFNVYNFLRTPKISLGLYFSFICYKT